LGLRATDLTDPELFARINEGAIAEQWIGQHLLDHRRLSQSPTLHYWVREKAGSMAEVDYLIPQGMRVVPIEVKAGSSSKAKSLQVFLHEKQSKLGVHFSANLPQLHAEKNILELPFYLVGQLGRVLK
jgi:predicted AAA+ superfamily ATPase